MAKLFTHHDRFHIHAAFGALALLHFLWRFIQLLRFGTSFPDHEPRWFQTAGVLIHFILPLLSFQFSLPQKRNMKKPMIWPEGRLHSLIFATRHVVATLCALWGILPNFSINSQQLEAYSADCYVALATEIIAKQALVLATCRAAQFATDKYGCAKDRTTNAMPYPENVDAETQTIIKTGYANKQFIATSYCLLGDPTAAFWPLIAIQGAALLLTLVRKGFVSATTYHRGYALQLLVPAWVFATRVAHGDSGYDQILAVLVALRLTRRLRFDFGYSPVGCWTIGVAAYVICRALIGDWNNYPALTNVWSHRIVLLLALHGCLPKREVPLFIGDSCKQNRLFQVAFGLHPSDAFRPSVEKRKL